MCRSLGLPDSPAWLARGCNDAAIIEVADVKRLYRALKPDFERCREWRAVTARGEREDISLSRVFVPYLGIDEDPSPVRACLVPYWADRLARTEFTALQASARTGLLHCRLEGRIRRDPRRPLPHRHCRAVPAMKRSPSSRSPLQKSAAEKAAIVGIVRRMEQAWNHGDFCGLRASRTRLCRLRRDFSGRLARHARPLYSRLRRLGGAPGSCIFTT